MRELAGHVGRLAGGDEVEGVGAVAGGRHETLWTWPDAGRTNV